MRIGDVSAMLPWRRAQLATQVICSTSRPLASSVSTGTGAGPAGWATSLIAANDQAIRRALESAGVEFIDENGGGPGLRLWEPPKQKR